MDSSRPLTQPGMTLTFETATIDEPQVMMYITEGSQEEIQYLKGFENSLRIKGKLKNQINICVNEQIDETILPHVKHQSHPQSRFNYLLNFKDNKFPNKSQKIEMWLICDRDTGSFKDEQYDLLLNNARLNHVHLVVSNPSFQLWLLFHFYSWLRESIYQDNISCKDQINLIERSLRRVLKSYKHGSLNYSVFDRHVQQAITNSCNYCLKIDFLKDEVGTNFRDIVNAF